MNILKYIPVALLLLLVSACNSDLEGVTYHEENVTPSVLSNIEASYELIADNSAEVAIKPSWTKTDFGFLAAVTYTLQMDFEGKNFQHPVTLASSTKLDAELTTLDLNNAIRRLQDNYELVEGVDDVQMIEIRVSSSIAETISPIFSNVYQTAIVPFSGEREYPSLAIRGDYAGWDFDKSQKIYSSKSDDSYKAMIFFDGKSQNGWKVCADADWTESWGLASDHSYVAEAPNVTLSGGDNITLYSKTSYVVEFNKTTLELKMSNPHESWGVVGANNSWGDSGPDTLLKLDTEVDKSGKVQHYLTATLDFEAGATWKIRPDNTWSDDIGPGSVTGEFDSSDGNFMVKEGGSYTIKWYFNKVEQKLMVEKN